METLDNMGYVKRGFIITILFVILFMGLVSAFSSPEFTWDYYSSKKISKISVSNNGQTLIAFDDSSLSLLNKDQGIIPLRSFNFNTRISAIDLSSDGSRMAIGTYKSISLSDSSGLILWMTEIDNTVLSVDISSDNSFIAVGTTCTEKISIADCNVVYLLDEQGGILWNYLSSAQSDSIKISENGDYLAVLQKTRHKVLLLNKEGKLLWEHNEKYSTIIDIAVMSDGGILLALNDGVIKKLQNIRDFDVTTSWIYNTHHIVGGVSVSDNGKYILTFKQVSIKSDYKKPGLRLLPESAIYDFTDCCYTYLLNEDGKLLWQEKHNMWLIANDISSNGQYISGHFMTDAQDDGVSFYDNSINIVPATTTPPPTTTPAPTTTAPKTIGPRILSRKEDFDTDGDGWTDDLENMIGTDPKNPDTDGDGIIDSKDPNPLKYGAEMGIDSDGDGWNDELEKKAGTDPFDADTDDDGIWDSKDPNPLVPETMAVEENGINWEALGVGLAVLAATGGWLITKRKKGKLKGLLSEIDLAFEGSKDDISKCKAELKKIQKKSLEALQKDEIDEIRYDIIQKKIRLCFEELKEKSWQSKKREVSQCTKCGGNLPIGSYGQVRCEFCNIVNYIPIPGEEEH